MQPILSPCRSRAVATMLVAQLAAALVTGCHVPGGAPPAGTAVRAALAQDDLAARDAGAELRAHAAAVFVHPFVDDSHPARFTEANRGLLCADHSRIVVDGQPLREGDPLPSGAFVMRWEMNLYCPYGISGPLLNGRAEVLVVRDDRQELQAMLHLQSLEVLASPLRIAAAAPSMPAGRLPRRPPSALRGAAERSLPEVGR